MPRIDTLKAGSTVELVFRYGVERAVFLGITGTGDDRRARFLQLNVDGEPYEWEAYRYNGRWAYGTSADRLTLYAVLCEIGPDHRVAA